MPRATLTLSHEHQHRACDNHGRFCLGVPRGKAHKDSDQFRCDSIDDPLCGGVAWERERIIQPRLDQTRVTEMDAPLRESHPPERRHNW